MVDALSGGRLEFGIGFGNTEQCIQIIYNAMRHYTFDTLTTTFNFGGLPHEQIKKSMRLFAKEVMPALR